MKEVCLELGVSKQAYYKWEKKAEAAVEKTLAQDRQGRKPKNHVSDENLRRELENARREKERLEKEKKRLERKNESVETELRAARKVVALKIATGELDLGDKKNAALIPVIRRLFSMAPAEEPR